MQRHPTNCESPGHASRRRPSGRRPSGRRGFSLIELLIVLALVAILAALVLPKVKLDNAQVDTAARTIGMSLMSAQRDAASRQHNVLVVFDTAGHSVRTIWDANNNGVIDNGEKSRPFLFPSRVVIGRPTGVPALAGATSGTSAMRSLPAGPVLIVQRNGSVDKAVTLYFSTLKAMGGGADKDARAVQISRATGRPDWYAWTGSRWRRGL